jgi:hypothetical protein
MLPNLDKYIQDLFLPGGFELANISNSFCNVQTAAGSLLNRESRFLDFLDFQFLTNEFELAKEF